MSFEEQEAYIASMKQKWDYDNSIEFAEQKGVLKVAKKMLKKGMSVEDIASCTDLTEEQINALR